MKLPGHTHTDTTHAVPQRITANITSTLHTCTNRYAHMQTARNIRHTHSLRHPASTTYTEEIIILLPAAPTNASHYRFLLTQAQRHSLLCGDGFCLLSVARFFFCVTKRHSIKYAFCIVCVYRGAYNGNMYAG